jgi:hypothetical protein
MHIHSVRSYYTKMSRSRIAVHDSTTYQSKNHFIDIMYIYFVETKQMPSSLKVSGGARCI